MYEMAAFAKADVDVILFATSIISFQDGEAVFFSSALLFYRCSSLMLHDPL